MTNTSQNACIMYNKSLKQKPSSTARAVYQNELDEASGDDWDYVEEEFAPNGVDTPSDDFYNINTTNFYRNHEIKSLIPRTPKGKPMPKTTSRYNGPVYHSKHIYDMLSEEVEKKLDKYNKEKDGDFQPNSNRMVKVHEQDHGEEDPPENPETDIDNYYTEECRIQILKN